MLSPSLCLPPPPPSFCPQSLLFPSVSPSVTPVAPKQDPAHFGALLLITGLFLSSHNRSQNQSSPHAQPIHPRLLCFECALRRGWGDLVQPVANCPSEGSVYVMGSCCSHQRIHSETQRHLARRILALPPNVSLPGWCSTQSC